MKWPTNRTQRSSQYLEGLADHPAGPIPHLTINTIWRLTPDEAWQVEMRNADMGDILDEHRPGNYRDIRIPIRDDAGLPRGMGLTALIVVPFSIALWVGGVVGVRWLIGHPTVAAVAALLALGLTGVALGRRA